MNTQQIFESLCTKIKLLNAKCISHHPLKSCSQINLKYILNCESTCAIFRRKSKYKNFEVESGKESNVWQFTQLDCSAELNSIFFPRPNRAEDKMSIFSIKYSRNFLFMHILFHLKTKDELREDRKSFHTSRIMFMYQTTNPNLFVLFYSLFNDKFCKRWCWS